MSDEEKPNDPAAAVQTSAPATEGLAARLRNHAQRAKDHASATAAGLAATASQMKEDAALKAGEMKDQAVAKAGEIGDHATDKATELKEAGVSMVSSMLEELNGALPAIKQAGFTLASLNVGIGLPPRVSAGFDVSGEVSAERFEELLAANADRKLTVIVMRSLHQAWQAQRRITVAGLKPKGLSIELGLIPNVSMKFG